MIFTIVCYILAALFASVGTLALYKTAVDPAVLEISLEEMQPLAVFYGVSALWVIAAAL